MKFMAFLLPVLLVMGLAMVCLTPSVQAVPATSSWNYVGITAGSGANSSHTFTSGYFDEYNVAAGTPISLILASYRANLNESSGGYYHGVVTIYDGTAQKSTWTEAASHHVASLGGGTSFAMAASSSLNFVTQTGHAYFVQYIILTTETADITSNVTDSLEFSLTIQEHPVPVVNNTVNWVYGIIWILVVFIVPWLFNFAVPRMGLILGLAIMTVVLMVSQSTFTVVALISFVTMGVMMFGLREEPEVSFG